MLHDLNDKQMTRCTNFIISKKLNNLEGILGAEFLFSEEKTITLDKSKLTINEKDISFQMKIFSDDTFPLNCQACNGKYIDVFGPFPPFPEDPMISRHFQNEAKLTRLQWGVFLDIKKHSCTS